MVVDKYYEEWKTIAIHRWMTVSDTLRVGILLPGAKRATSYSPREIISEIEKDTEVGKWFVKREKEYLQALKTIWKDLE